MPDNFSCALCCERGVYTDGVEWLPYALAGVVLEGWLCADCVNDLVETDGRLLLPARAASVPVVSVRAWARMRRGVQWQFHGTGSR